MNLEQAKTEFLNYVKNYDETNSEIKRKRDHSLRVMQISEEIATNIGLSKEEIEIAALIGLLHDIARFEQVRIYNTFKDSISFDHGDYGVKVLTENNYIRKYIEENKYDDIILKAVKNHNKFKIEDGLSSKQLKFTKIIRDADKLDILYQATYLSWINKTDVEKAKLTIHDIKPFLEKRLGSREKDFKQLGSSKRILILLGFPFDINYNVTFKYLKNGDYINKILDGFHFEDKETSNIMEEVRNILNQYIESKQKG